MSLSRQVVMSLSRRVEKRAPNRLQKKVEQRVEKNPSAGVTNRWRRRRRTGGGGDGAMRSFGQKSGPCSKAIRCWFFCRDSGSGSGQRLRPHILHHNGQWWMWYGGQGDGHDAIFVAFSDDLNWTKRGRSQSDSRGGPGVPMNDPSVVFVGGTFFMYYTRRPSYGTDEVPGRVDGRVELEQTGVGDRVGPPGSWESDRVGRPSIVENEEWMWYDGQIFGIGRHVG